MHTDTTPPSVLPSLAPQEPVFGFTPEELAWHIALDCSPGDNIARKIALYLTCHLHWPAVSVRAMLPELFPMVTASVESRKDWR